ncbi:MAG: hypoxanthine phosphoribosyltransferase [Armatimonadetes bacterium]|nr:hypoxanthine phosphoribosyltransferase [Armatimonadota bacterium]
MMRDVAEILLTREEIRARVQDIGYQISRDFQEKDLLLVGILKGSMIFLADLLRVIQIPVLIDFMSISSYGAATASSGVVRILKDLEEPIEGRNVVVVEDIVDTGLTLSYLMRNLQSRQPKSLRICALLDKPARRIVDVDIAYKGFSIEDRFVVGYGLDFAEHYRHLPYICVLKDEVIKGGNHS